MPSFSRDFRHFEAGRAAADHHDLAGGLGPGNEAFVDLQLAARARIVNAANALFLPHLIDAAVVAGDAGPHEIGAAPGQLVGGLRVGDQLPRPADEVGVAGFQQGFGALRRGDAAKSDNRQLRGFLERAIQPIEGLGGDRGRRDLHPVT